MFEIDDAPWFARDENGEYRFVAEVNDVDLSWAEIEEIEQRTKLRITNLFNPITFEAKVKSAWGLKLLEIGFRASEMLRNEFDRKHRI